MNLDKVTLIIPPHNRPGHLRRCLESLESYGLKIIISESSPTKTNLDTKHSQITEHLHFPNFSFTDKIHETLKKVTSPYVILLAEDDFLHIEALIDGIIFLENNPDYSSVQGSYTKFWVDKSLIRHKHTYKIADQRDINQKSPYLRARSYFKYYFQCFYALHRADHIKSLFEMASKNAIHNMFAIEMMIALSSLAAGKHRVLPVFFGSRESIENSVGRNSDNFESFMKEEKYAVQRQAFIDYYDILFENKTKEIVKEYFTNTDKMNNFPLAFFLKIKYAFQRNIGSYDNRFLDKQKYFEVLTEKYLSQTN